MLDRFIVPMFQYNLQSSTLESPSSMNFCHISLLNLKKDSQDLTLKSLVFYSCYQRSAVTEKMTQIFQKSLLKLHTSTLMICLTQLCYQANIEECDCSTPKKLIDVFKECDAMTFPNIYVLLQLALTLPITSCECERSFSQLKLIKTAHRSTKTASRLSGLALMKINRDKCERIYNSHSELTSLAHTFHQMYPRRMKLPFLLSD